jgi:hypothetical protein
MKRSISGQNQKNTMKGSISGQNQKHTMKHSFAFYSCMVDTKVKWLNCVRNVSEAWVGRYLTFKSKQIGGWEN